MRSRLLVIVLHGAIFARSVIAVSADVRDTIFQYDDPSKVSIVRAPSAVIDSGLDFPKANAHVTHLDPRSTGGTKEFEGDIIKVSDAMVTLVASRGHAVLELAGFPNPKGREISIAYRKCAAVNLKIEEPSDPQSLQKMAVAAERWIETRITTVTVCQSSSTGSTSPSGGLGVQAVATTPEGEVQLLGSISAQDDMPIDQIEFEAEHGLVRRQTTETANCGQNESFCFGNVETNNTCCSNDGLCGNGPDFCAAANCDARYGYCDSDKQTQNLTSNPRDETQGYLDDQPEVRQPSVISLVAAIIDIANEQADGSNVGSNNSSLLSTRDQTIQIVYTTALATETITVRSSLMAEYPPEACTAIESLIVCEQGQATYPTASPLPFTTSDQDFTTTTGPWICPAYGWPCTPGCWCAPATLTMKNPLNPTQTTVVTDASELNPHVENTSVDTEPFVDISTFSVRLNSTSVSVTGTAWSSATKLSPHMPELTATTVISAGAGASIYGGFSAATTSTLKSGDQSLGPSITTMSKPDTWIGAIMAMLVCLAIAWIIL